MKKLLFLDTETTGLDPQLHTPVQIAYIIDIDGQIVNTGNFLCKPFPQSHIDQEALKVNNLTLDQIMAFADPQLVHNAITESWSGFVDKYNKFDKFTVVGHCAQFDVDMLSWFFRKCSDMYFGSWINGKLLDTCSILRYMDYCNLINLPSYKLSAVCEYYDIPLQAHDALADITACRALFYRLPRLYADKN